jgi:hypothetical protein
MSDNEKIYADAGEEAALSYGTTSARCVTLQEAVLEWMRLSADDKKLATIRVRSGKVYDASQIDRLHISAR